MLVVRDILYCKPGQVRPMVEKLKAMSALTERMGLGKARIMTDLSAERYWMVVSEWEVPNLAAFDDMMKENVMQNKELEAVMKGYHSFVESGRRELYTLEA